MCRSRIGTKLSRAASLQEWSLTPLLYLNHHGVINKQDECNLMLANGTGVAQAGSQPSTPVPFFPEVHEELTGTWKAPFTARNRVGGPSSLTTLDGGVAKGYTRIPPMQMCPNSTWLGEPSYRQGLPDLWGSCIRLTRYGVVAGLHEGGHDPQVLQELRATTDHALHATKVTAKSVGHAMSTLVVQERHLWLCLADMRDTDKVRFLNSPVSQIGLFSDIVENFAPQF